VARAPARPANGEMDSARRRRAKPLVLIVNYANRRTEWGHAIEGNRVKLMGVVPPVLFSDDPIRADARQK
jgi:hypothetical protein